MDCPGNKVSLSVVAAIEYCEGSITCMVVVNVFKQVSFSALTVDIITV